MNLVPRHELIVSRILGNDYWTLITRVIGIAEILMAIWILSGIRSRWCALCQIGIVGIMNIIEFAFTPDLLLFGRFNIIFASFFMVLVYIHEFVIPDKVVTSDEIQF